MKDHEKKFLPSLFVATGILLLSSLNGLASDIKIIANSSVAADSISVRELKSVFLGEKNRMGGAHIEPVLEKSGPAHEVFLQRYLGQSDFELQTHYRSLVVTGQGAMPKELSSDADVVNYVSQTRGAIGYVSAETDAPGVKVLSVSDAAGNSERRLLSRVEPAYPEELLKRSIGGIVRLKVTIAANGNVENAELLGGNPVLGDAAIAAVTKWRYSPGASRTVTEVSVPFDPH